SATAACSQGPCKVENPFFLVSHEPLTSRASNGGNCRSNPGTRSGVGGNLRTRPGKLGGAAHVQPHPFSCTEAYAARRPRATTERYGLVSHLGKDRPEARYSLSQRRTLLH